MGLSQVYLRGIGRRHSYVRPPADSCHAPPPLAVCQVCKSRSHIVCCRSTRCVKQARCAFRCFYACPASRALRCTLPSRSPACSPACHACQPAPPLGVRSPCAQSAAGFGTHPPLQICAGSLRALRLMMADLDSSAVMAASSAASPDTSLAPPPVVFQLRSGERPPKGDEEQQQKQQQGEVAAGADGSSSWHNGLRGLAGLAGLRGAGQRRVEMSSAPSAGSTPAAARPVSPDPVDWTVPNGRV